MTLIDDAAAPDLSAVAGCSRDDVAVNATGRLSEGQKRLLYGRLRREALGAIPVVIFLALWIHGNGPGLIALLVALGAGWGALTLVRKALLVAGGRVSRVEGDAWTEFVPDSDGPDRHFIYVGGLKLETTEPVFKAATPGGPYSVYYLAGSKIAVSAVAQPGWRPVERPARAEPKRRWSFTLGGE